MDIRYFEFLDRLKRVHDDASNTSCLRGETDNRTQPLTGELGVQIPPGAPKSPRFYMDAGLRLWLETENKD